MSLERRIEDARARTVAWLGTMQAPGAPRGVCRISAAHDPAQWPGMLLPGTYNAVMCSDLLGALDADRGAVVAWLEQSRLPDGRFRIAGMHAADVFKKPDAEETWRYIDWHVTNYSLGAIQALNPARPKMLEFAKPFLDRTTLLAWLALRDLRDPWQEGNSIVNLGSFLVALDGRDALAELFAWHDRLQDPDTGFWGVGQAGDATRRLHAFAGSMHNFHLYYALGRALPYQDRAVDYVLSLPPEVHSACIDVDAIDLLVHAHHMMSHRRSDIEAWVATLLDALLAFQEPDGGFCDVRSGTRRQDGWVRGYAEPQGISNSFATWFRWIGIAMAADLLLPGRWNWCFRRMVGIGYRAW
jgi:hypothetical protein